MYKLYLSSKLTAYFLERRFSYGLNYVAKLSHKLKEQFLIKFLIWLKEFKFKFIPVQLDRK